MERNLLCFATALLLAVAGAANASAQVNAIVGGTVADGSGALIPGV
jgi:hypothetical protein